MSITKNILYNGEVELTFDSIKHTYEANGQIVFGVTSVVGVLDKPALVFWAVNQAIDYLRETLKPGTVIDEVNLPSMLEAAKTAHRKKSKEAADIGTIVHEWLERYLRAGIDGEVLPEMPVNPKIRKAIEAFLAWTKENKVKFIASERKIYSRKYGYAGTLDAIAYVNGELSVIDFKTSNGIYDDYFVQTAAYANAVNEEDGTNIESCYILRIPKDGSEFEVRKDDNYPMNLESFLGCLKNYQRKMYLKGQEIKAYKVKLEKVKEAIHA